ncbi:hypothetical protein B0J14DRAFT_607269 [Halenospora varia]|nr:hypothetical protein B0J14DRAFT_607269 [Halenospora varia]
MLFPIPTFAGLLAVCSAGAITAEQCTEVTDACLQSLITSYEAPVIKSTQDTAIFDVWAHINYQGCHGGRVNTIGSYCMDYFSLQFPPLLVFLKSRQFILASASM